ncbi:hypothetical protein WR25_06537 isoform B [Diploscapter pachys]|nr:hypothetical protein WR25_06537 isoform B [Diploscapter pachys]
MKISPQTLPIESRQGDKIIQLEPQQVVLRMKAGETLTVPFKYLHKSMPGRPPLTDFQIQTSAWEKTGAQLEFMINCNGAEIKGNKCSGISEGQVIEWKIKVTLNQCMNSGDIAISIGVIGYQSVSAIFITPLCGCDCEKLQRQEKNSVLCHQHGNLICGQCVCDATRGGSKCECPLASYGVKTAAELEDKCREQPGAQVCNGKGVCRCGQCECDRKIATVGGKFCQCDHDSCPRGANGKLCSGNGVCDCGTCKCEDGYSKEDCSCKSDDAQCIESGQKKPTPAEEKTTEVPQTTTRAETTAQVTETEQPATEEAKESEQETETTQPAAESVTETSQATEMDDGDSENPPTHEPGNLTEEVTQTEQPSEGEEEKEQSSTESTATEEGEAASSAEPGAQTTAASYNSIPVISLINSIIAISLYRFIIN